MAYCKRDDNSNVEPGLDNVFEVGEVRLSARKAKPLLTDIFQEIVWWFSGLFDYVSPWIGQFIGIPKGTELSQ